MSEPSDGDEPSYPQANFAAVRALAGALATTLGPTPRDKLIIEALATRQEASYPGEPAVDEFTVTSDGATILESLDLEHPVAPVVRRIAGPERPGATGVEGEDIPDGVTSTLVLAASLLDEAEGLLERGLHPQAVSTGYGSGLDVALEALDAAARPFDAFDRPVTARRDVARTAMTGNDVGGLRDRLASLAVDAVAAVGPPRPETFVVRTVRDGSVDDSRLVRGTVLDRSDRVSEAMPRRVEDARLLVLAGQDEGGLRTLEYDDAYRIEAERPDEFAAFQDLEADRRAGVLERLEAHGVDVVVAQQGIEKEYATELAARGVLGIDGVTPLDLRAVALATGAEPVHKTDDFEADDLGRAGSVSEERIAPIDGGRRRRRVIVIDDCEAPGSVCVYLRGVSGPLADQAASTVRTAAAAVALAEGLGTGPAGVLPGGGAADLQVATALRDATTEAGTRSALAIEAFADAAEGLVGALAANAGADRLTTIADLRAAHRAGDVDHGFLIPPGAIGDAVEAGVLDALATRRGVYTAAVEVATLLLGIDDAIDATPSEEPPDPDDAIYEDAAEQQQSYLDKHDDTRWD